MCDRATRLSLNGLTFGFSRSGLIIVPAAVGCKPVLGREYRSDLPPQFRDPVANDIPD
jgi:hypothetical protein